MIPLPGGLVDLRQLDANFRPALFRAQPDQDAFPDALIPDLTSFCLPGKDRGGIHPPFSPFAWRGERPADCRKDGGYGVLSFFAGTSSKEQVDGVGHEDLAG